MYMYIVYNDKSHSMHPSMAYFDGTSSAPSIVYMLSVAVQNFEFGHIFNIAYEVEMCFSNHWQPY